MIHIEKRDDSSIWSVNDGGRPERSFSCSKPNTKTKHNRDIGRPINLNDKAITDMEIKGTENDINDIMEENGNTSCSTNYQIQYITQAIV